MKATTKQLEGCFVLIINTLSALFKPTSRPSRFYIHNHNEIGWGLREVSTGQVWVKVHLPHEWKWGQRKGNHFTPSQKNGKPSRRERGRNK